MNANIDRCYMKRYILGLSLLVMSGLASATTIISIEDFGLKPNTGEDTRPYLHKALQACRNQKDVVLYFPKGRYDFYPEKSNERDVLKRPATLGIHLKELDNFTFDGGGSEFIFHGKMEIAHIEDCENLTMRNFSVDWERPFISQGEIVGSTDSYLDVKIDKKNYPYEVVDGKVYFIGEDWKLPVMTMYSTLYDKSTKEIAYNTWDATLGDIFEKPVEEVADGVLRFHGKPAIQVEPNTTMVSLFHVRYFATGIGVTGSRNILWKDIKMYHSLSNGFWGYRTENITMDNASVTVNDAKGRYFSSVADASHFSECGGTIRVLNCAHTGQADDFINVHGTSVKIIGRVDPNTILVPANNKGSGRSVQVGDEYWFIKQPEAQRGEVGVVSGKKLSEDGASYYISFAEPLPAEIGNGDFMECKTWCAAVEIRNCKIQKRHRARGILVTTPKKVVIEDNYFSTAGTAILIEGDFDYWYESGANTDVTIRNNTFYNCLTSGNRDGNRGQWGEAVITITPSHIPSTVDMEPYHKNIRIVDNRFYVFDVPLVRAVSTRGLHFTDNQVIKTTDYRPYTWQKVSFLLDGCRDVKIQNNSWDKRYTERSVAVEHMRLSDVQTDAEDHFVVKELKDVDTHMQW